MMGGIFSRKKEIPIVDVRVVVAIFDYNARDKTDISFLRKDRMELLNATEDDWWEVRNLRTNEKGLVPKSFVADEGSVEYEEWYFGVISRKEAERHLMAMKYIQGTFLVRGSEQFSNRFSLSVKDYDSDRGYHVKHYKIKPVQVGVGYYIASNQIYDTVSLLIEAYSKNAMGLNHILTKSCCRPEPVLHDLAPSMRKNYEIDRKEIELKRKLGSGNFGEVWYGIWNGKTHVAVKTLKEGSMSREAFLQEAEIMKQFRHSRLVALFAICSKDDPIFIIQEYMSKGSLIDFLKTKEGRKLKLDELAYIAFQIASGMEYLERKALVHRDLAARNVLVGENIVTKVADFGLARIIKDEVYNATNSLMLPVRWTAPEALTHGIFSIKSDVWSFGILLMELFTYGRTPYMGMSNSEVADKVERGYRMPNPPKSNIPGDIYQKMRECWHTKEERRPTFEYLKDYFENFSVSSELQYRDIN